MNKTCQLKCKDFFRFVKLCSFPFIHCVKECQHTDTFENVSISYISPILVKLKWGSLVWIKPYRTALCFAHLLSFGVQKQCNCHSRSIFSKFTTNQLCTCKHIAPLIISAKFQITAVFLEQLIEIIRLHDHVVELEEAKPFFHSLLVTLCCQHTVYRKMRTNFAKDFYIVQPKKPVCIINHKCFSI